MPSPSPFRQKIAVCLIGAMAWLGLVLPAKAQETTDTPAPTFTTATLTPQNSPEPPAPSTPPGSLDQWSVVSAGVISQLWQIAWTGKAFVCVGNKGVILTSPDGIAWTKQNSKTPEHLFGIGFNGSLCVVGGENGTIVTSPDLKEWTAQKSGLTERVFTVVWTGAKFVALAVNTVATSVDGVAWSAQNTVNENGFHHGIWARDKLIVSTVNTMAFSTDGIRWITTLRTQDKMFDVATDGSLNVAIGAPLNLLYISTDGQSWTTRPTGARNGLSAVTWTGRQFVAVGGNGTLVSSPDGMNWTLGHIGNGLNLTSIAAHDDTLVIATLTGEILVNKKVTVLAAPEISFAPGAPGSVPKVRLASAMPGAKVYYTLDGSEPTESSTPYATPFTPAAVATIKARAYKEGLPASEVSAAQFTPGT